VTGGWPLDLTTDFFYGQLIGLLSLVPAGFGSSDAFWIARLPFERSVTAAAFILQACLPWTLDEYACACERRAGSVAMHS